MWGEYRESEANHLMHVKLKANKPTPLNLCGKTSLSMAVGISNTTGGTGVESPILPIVRCSMNVLKE
jgi:hypothetical protein